MKSLKRKIVAVMVAITIIAVAGIASAGVPAPEVSASTETKEQRDSRMAWWRDARFGMFIHWGLYSIPAGSWDGKPVPDLGEWIMAIGKIPVADYQALAGKFNPTKFDADKIVRLAKDAGMKYIIITSKHHDGFAMFRSKVSKFNIYDATPFKRDPLKELAAACKEHNMRLGFYYSQAQDWNHPGGASAKGYWDKAMDGDMDAYIRDVAVPQVREILSGYGQISVLWWDTACGMTKERADKFLPLLKLQPGIITNNRLGYYIGDTETPEQTIPATGFPDRDWETCMTINNTWGFKSYDHDWKSTEVLLRNLIDIASKGGNYLLNIGPTCEGVVPQESVDRLSEVGKWMKVNGESIYGTSASPFERLPWGRCTQKTGKLYLHVFEWPTDGILNVPVTTLVKKAYLLSKPRQALKVTNQSDSVDISVPKVAPDPIASLVVVEYMGSAQPQVLQLRQAGDGSITLRAMNASIIGSTALIEGAPESNVGRWMNADDQVQWKVDVNKTGQFEVSAIYSCDPGTAGAEFAVEINDASVKGKITATDGWNDYRKLDIGKIKIEKTGMTLIVVKPISKPGFAVANLRTIKLVPVAQ